MLEKFLTVQEAAEIFNVHPHTIIKYLANGQLRGAKIGRVWRMEEKDLRDFFETMKNMTSKNINK